ncbi:MAG: hypothetical protein WCJ87_08500 [Burkholderiales bacterium]
MKNHIFGRRLCEFDLKKERWWKERWWLNSFSGGVSARRHDQADAVVTALARRILLSVGLDAIGDSIAAPALPAVCIQEFRSKPALACNA